jgi:hypothetical protein
MPEAQGMRMSYVKLYNRNLFLLIGQTLFMSLPLLVFVNLTLWLGYEFTVQNTKERWLVLSELSADSTLYALEQRWNDLRADLNMLAANPDLARAVQQHDKSLLDDIAADWELFITEKCLYDQVRLLDLSGMERLRVDLMPHGASRVPKRLLQDKSQRYYFQRALVLEADEIYASPIDLNVEQGEIELPFKPMLRLVTPLQDERGEISALLVINALASHIFDDLERHARLVDGQMLFLDEFGYYLRGFSEYQEWGFMFPEDERQSQRFDKTYPETWNMMQQRESGQINNQQGIYSFRTLNYGSQGYEQRYRLVVAMSQGHQLAQLAPQRALWRGVALTLSMLLLFYMLFVNRYRMRQWAAKPHVNGDHQGLRHYFR